MNNTVEFLDSCKERLRLTYIIYLEVDSSQFNFNLHISNEEFREARRIIMNLAKQRNIGPPSILIDSRLVEEFCHGLYTEVGSEFEDQLKHISIIFNEYINYLEENMYEVQIVKIECEIPLELTYENIVNDFNNCDYRIQMGDYSGAITSARSLIEGVCKEILLKFDVDMKNEKPNVPTLFKNVRDVLNLDASNEKLEKPLRNVISGLNKVVDGLNEIRNISGDGHSGQKKPTFHHAVLTVNAAKTIVSFLFHTYEYQKAKGKLQPTPK